MTARLLYVAVPLMTLTTVVPASVAPVGLLARLTWTFPE